jgi:hypothetical protein
VLSHDDEDAWPDEPLSAVIFYGLKLDAAMVDFVLRRLSKEPKGWVLVA